MRALRLAPGTTLGPYVIIAPLGAGGMGEVYRARDERLAREVAIKVLPAWAAADPEMLRRLEAEARAAGALNHPGILSIFDVGRADTGPFIVSELLSGETLRARLSRGALRVPDAVDFGQQIAQALATAHEHGIVHRDLKPENLFVTADGRIKILDFGIARLMPHASSSLTTGIRTGPAETMPGMVLGTYGYMSPEQANGSPVDHRADIFSLGAVLFEMLSGRPAFDGTSPAEIARAVVGKDPDALTQGTPALQQVMLRCLAKEPARRFQSARDLAFALGTAGTDAAAPLTVPARVTRPRILWAAFAGAALIVPALLLRGHLTRPAGPVHISSLAVLPLANYSATPGEEYFADSMTEAMITDLARISALTVTSRTSVMRYKATKKSMREIASELEVDAVVEASFVKVGDRVQISANLVDGRTDRSLWSRKYERQMHDVLDLQSEVARAISHEISVTLTPREQAYLDAERDVDPAAYEAYLRGRYELNRYTEESMHQALRYFGQAIQKDPRSARAYAGRSDTYSALRSIYAPPDTVMPQAKADALKAIELDDSLAAGHVALGFVLMFYDWDLKAAEREFDRAIELNGGLALAHDGRAQLLAAATRPAEATAEVERTLKLDPLSPTLRLDAAWVYYLAGRNDLVIAQAQKAIDLDPEFWMGYTMLGLGYEKLGKYPEAMKALEKARSLDDSPFILEILGGLYATSGKHAEAQAVLKDLHEQEKRRYVCAYEVATIYAGLGDRANTLSWLEKGRKQRADCMPWAAVDPKLDRLRGDKEFQALLHRLGPQSEPTPGR